jgi:hypothetical protein
VPQNEDTVCENAFEEKVHCFTVKFESLHQAFGTSDVSIAKLLRRVSKSRIQTSGKVSLQLLVE